MTVHVECALVPFVVEGPGPEKRLAAISSASSKDCTPFFSSFFKHYYCYYLFPLARSGSDAATCRQAHLSQPETVWIEQLKKKKEKKNPIPFHRYTNMTRKYIDFYTYMCAYIHA